MKNNANGFETEGSFRTVYKRKENCELMTHSRMKQMFFNFYFPNICFVVDLY